MSAICLSLSSAHLEDWRASVRRCLEWISMVELRVDLLDPGEREADSGALHGFLDELRELGLQTIWTVRWSGETGAFTGDESERAAWLARGDRWGAEYVDIEWRSGMLEHFRPGRSRLILSHHDFSATPPDADRLVREMSRDSPDILKVAFQCSSTADLLRTVRLYRSAPPGKLIAIAMGEWGESSRILPAALGMPWSFGCDPLAAATAPGQFDVRELKELYRLDRAGTHTPLYAVLGDPVAHSLSPRLHNSAYAALGLDALYGRIHVDRMADFYELADVLGLRGASVTVPHKEALITWAGEEHPLRRVGAANTLIRTTQGWNIDNTDIAAAMEAIREKMPDRKTGCARRALLLGAGGVARGLGWGLKRQGWDVTLCNRSAGRAHALAGELGCATLEWERRSPQGYDLIVNGTSLGMPPQSDQTPLELSGDLQNLTVFDTVYTPPDTLLLRQARAAGAATIPGAGMFYRQAALQHQRWFGGEAPMELMREISKHSKA